MGRSAVPISWARGRTLRGFRDPVKPERPFSRWPRPHWPERPPEGSHCASVAASGCGPHAPESPLHTAPADRFAPLFAGCTRSTSARRALEPARRTRPPALIEAPPSPCRPVRLTVLLFRCRGHVLQHPSARPRFPCTTRLGMVLRARSPARTVHRRRRSVHRRRCRHTSACRCVRGPRAPPAARRPERSAPPTRGSTHRAPALPAQEFPPVSVPARAAAHDRPASERIVTHP